MFENLFSHIDIDPLNIDIPNGQAPSLLDECNRYEEAIRNAGGIDLFVSGIGSDGHLAFNEPGSSLNSRTRVQALNNETILANSRFFQNDCSQVPIKAITVGVGTLMEAKEILVLASGSHKALAVHKAVEKGISHMCTASALQSHNNCIWLVDEEASQELKVKTVNFYRSQLPEYHKILSNITPLHQQPCNITNNNNNKNCLN
uniref:Glucosamine-6-phosphate isomerase n=1 Tax=Meloidogyne javanica TaxID=6303 RepID=A0A915LDB8_MELJA